MQLVNHPQHARREPCFLLSLLSPEYFLPSPFFFHFPKLFGRVLQTEMRIGVHRHANLTVPHQILERLRVHAGLRHVAAISVSAMAAAEVMATGTAGATKTKKDNKERTGDEEERFPIAVFLP